VSADERVLIVDYGSQYTQLIARRIRELHVYCEIVPPAQAGASARLRKPAAVVLSGGPSSVFERGAPELDRSLLELGVPVLAICYGMQLLVHSLGGRVSPAPQREYGRAVLEVLEADPLLADVPARSTVWMSHGDKVDAIPFDFRVLARSENSPYAAVRHETRPHYGIVFHPEVAHSEFGERMLANFLRGIAGLRGEWTMRGFLAEKSAELERRIGNGRVVCGVSGGVDSSVVAALLQRAIGERLSCIFVDTGLLRANEPEEVRAIFARLGIPLRSIDASSRFLARLRGIDDPEKKRVAIGHTFVEVFEEAAREIDGARFLAQGTLYPDVIESVSVSGPSRTIKTHHNVGGLPERMNLEVVEPLRELFKDEVRELAAELGVPRELYARHPFPGPGLAVRILGEVSAERLQIVRGADRILDEEIRSAGWYDRLWQAFAVFLPVRTVGVMGDGRTYEHVIALRCVTSRDAMTADWAPLPHELVGRISNRIINEVTGVNRVVYDVSSKPPATIEWE
jgi:GMP synthase (glutamine-hydrolysing)